MTSENQKILEKILTPEELAADNAREDAVIAELEEELWNSPTGSPEVAPECEPNCDIPNCPYTH